MGARRRMLGHLNPSRVMLGADQHGWKKMSAVGQGTVLEAEMKARTLS